MFSLKNQKVLITGGTKGIGKATVALFLELGAEVVFTARDKNTVLALESELKQKYLTVTGIVADVTNIDDTAEVINYIKNKWGKLDVLVNNAGTNIRKPTVDYTAEEFQAVINTNIIAPFNLSVKAYPLLLNSDYPSIINVASIAGNLDVRTGSPYGISKAGIIQLTRNLAVEWAENNIRVNSVSPWFTETPLTEGLLKEEAKLSKVIERTPLKRVAKPIEMAATIAFLAMKASSYITAQNIIVDGGMTANAL
jgi:tropinone reductase I